MPDTSSHCDIAMSPAPLWRRWREKVWTWWQRGDWADAAGADWRERIMDADMTDRFHAKQGRSTGRLILEKDGRALAVYVKRHYRLGWLQGLAATLWPRGAWSPAFEEFRNLQWALAQGIPVPPLVAMGQSVGPKASLQSVLVIEELKDQLALHEAIPLAEKQLDSRTFLRWKKGLIAELARLCHVLHDRNRFHKDLYLCHFYIEREDCGRMPESWRDRVAMIDFHRLAHHPLTWPVRLVKDLGGLLFSSFTEGVTPRDRVYFWRCYNGGQKPGWWRRTLGWFVRFKGQQYWQHNRKLQAKRAPRPENASRRPAA